MSEYDPSNNGNEEGDPFGFAEAFSDKGENEEENFEITEETTKEDIEGNLSGYLEAHLDDMDSDVLLSVLKNKLESDEDGFKKVFSTPSLRGKLRERGPDYIKGMVDKIWSYEPKENDDMPASEENTVPEKNSDEKSNDGDSKTGSEVEDEAVVAEEKTGEGDDGGKEKGEKELEPLSVDFLGDHDEYQYIIDRCEKFYVREIEDGKKHARYELNDGTFYDSIVEPGINDKEKIKEEVEKIKESFNNHLHQVYSARDVENLMDDIMHALQLTYKLREYDTYSCFLEAEEEIDDEAWGNAGDLCDELLDKASKLEPLWWGRKSGYNGANPYNMPGQDDHKKFGSESWGLASRDKIVKVRAQRVLELSLASLKEGSKIKSDIIQESLYGEEAENMRKVKDNEMDLIGEYEVGDSENQE